MALNKRYQAGTAWIKVAPDFRGWKDDLQRQVENSAKQLSARVSLDTNDARDTLRDFERQNAKVEANVKLSQSDLARVREQLAGLHKHKRDVTIRTELDNKHFREQLREVRHGFDKLAIPADVKLNKKSVTRTYDRLQKDFAQRAAEGVSFDSKSLGKAFESALRVDKSRADIARVTKDLEALNKVEEEFERKRKDYALGRINDFKEVTRLAEEYEAHQAQIANAQKRLGKYTRQQNAAQRKLNKDLKVAEELSRSSAQGQSGVDPRVTRRVRTMSARRLEMQATEKDLARLEKAQERYNQKLRQYQKNEISWSEISKLADEWAIQEQAADKARKKLTEFTEAQNTAQRKLNRELQKARENSEQAMAARRRPELAAHPEDKDVVYVDRVREAARSSKVGNSKLEGDVVALRNATQSARALDSANHNLARSVLTLEKNQLALAAAQLEVNNLRARGNISSKNGAAALDRESRAFHAVTMSARQSISARRAVDGLRESYNETANVLQRRIDLNPIRRFGDVVQNTVARGISFFTDRLILAGRLISSVGAVGMAAGAALAGLGLVNMIPLVGSLSQVVGVLGLIPGLAATAGAALGAISVGMSGIGGAFKAAGKLSDALGAGGSDSRAAQTARKELDKANRAAAKTAVQGARSIADAEKGIQRAQKSSADAQKDLSKARKDAQRQNEDLTESIRDMAYEEEDAALSVEEARERLGEVLRDPESTANQRRRADLSYRQALEQQRDLRREHGRTKEEYADAQRKGIEGSDVVVEAQERVREAAEGVADAQQSLAQAQQDAAEANAEAMERVAEAQENVVAAMGGGDAAAKALEEYNRELEKLAPNAQGFVAGVYGMRDAWMDLRNAVQQRLFRGIGEDVHYLAKEQLPLLEVGLGKTAAAINVGMRHALDYLGSQRATMDFTSIFNNSAEATEGFARSTSNLLQALIPVAEVGTRFMPWFGRSLDDTTRRWRVMAENAQDSGAMEAYFARSITRTQQLGKLLGALGGIAKEAFRVTSGLGLESLTSIISRLQQVRTDLQGESGTRLASNFAGVREAFHSALNLAGALVQIVINDVVPAFRLIADVTGPIVQAIANLGVLISEHIPFVRTLLSLYLAFKVINMTMGGLGRAMDRLRPKVEGHVPLTQRLRDSWNAATKSKERYSSQTTRLGSGLQAFGVQNGKIQALGRSWDNAANSAGRMSTVMGGVRGAASSLFSFLGGGWGVAFAGLAVGYMLWDSHRRKIKEAEEAARKYGVAMEKAGIKIREAIRESRGDTGSQVLTATEEEFETRLTEIERTAKDGGPSFLDRVNRVVNGSNALDKYLLTDRAQGLTRQVTTEFDAKVDAKKTAEAQRNLLAKLKYDASDLARAVAGTEQEWRKYDSTLRANGETGKQLADIIAERRGQIQDEARLVRDLTPGYLDLVDALDTLGDSSSSTADKFDALRRAFDSLIPGNEQQEALAKYGETIDEIRKKVEQVDPKGGMGAELFDNGVLDVANSANARTLNQSIMEGQQAVAEAQMQNVDPEKLKQLWANYDSAIRTLGGSMGVADSTMDDLLTKMFSTPDQVTSVVVLENADPVSRDLGAISLMLQSLHNQGKPIEGQIEINSTEAYEALEATGAQLEHIEGKQWAVKFDTEESFEDFQRLQAMLTTWNTVKSSATVDLDTDTFKLKEADARRLLGVLDQYKSEPWATLLHQSLIDNQGGAIQLLDELAGHPAAATARLELDQLRRDVLEATEIIDPRNWVLLQGGAFTGKPEDKSPVTDPFDNDTGIELPGWMRDGDQPAPGANKPANKPAPAAAEPAPAPAPAPAPTRAGDVPAGAHRRADGQLGYVKNPKTGYAAARGWEWVPKGDGFVQKKRDDYSKVLKQRYLGGRLPMLGLGGRMPTSGPGTERRDGFLAVGPDGMPQARVDGGEWVINSRSSEEWDWLLAAINSGKLRGFAAGGSLAGRKSGSFGLGAVGNPFGSMANGVMGLGGAFGQAIDGALPAWKQFGSTLASTAANFIQPALSSVNSAITQMGIQFPLIAQTRVTPAWLNMANLLNTAKQSIIDPMFAGVGTRLDDLTAHFPAAAAIIEPTWLNLTSRILAAKTGTIDPAFTGVKEGLRNVQSAFGIAVPAIATQWDGIRSATADPVRFTINTVFNDGLVGMWNSVSDLIGSKPMPRYTAKFARGGVLPGNTPGVDIHTFYSPTLGELHLGGGEGIIRPEAVRAMGGARAIDQINKDAREGRLHPVKGNPAHYANGGVFGRFARGGTISGGHIQGGAEITSPIQRVMWDAVRTAFPNVNLVSGTRYADVGSGFDNHMGQRALDLTGPMPQIARWIYQLNKTQPVEELIHAPLGGWQNLKAGRPLNYGAGTDADHYDHVHWAMAAMRSFAGRLVSMAGGGAPGAPMQSPADMVKDLLKPMKAEVQQKISAKKFPGMMGQLPGLIFGSLSKQIESQAVNLAQMSGMYSGPAVAPGGSVERWRPMVIAALRRNGFDPSRRNQDLMLSQIQSESSGNEKAIQTVIDVNSGGNEAGGLLQMTPGTYEAHRDPSLPNDRFDAWSNMNASLRYYRREYGDDLGTMWGKGHGYDRGGMWENNTLGWNTSGKPEAVFTNKEWLLVDKLVRALTKPEMFRALTAQPTPVAMGATPTPEKLRYTPPEEPKDEEVVEEKASPIEFAPAKIDPETSQPYEVDPETGVPIDPKTGTKFTVDPVTQQAITTDDRGLYIDPETGKPFYGTIGEKAQNSATTKPAIEYTPAKVNPETGQPYETDQNTGVPIDPKTSKPFEVDPATGKPIAKDERGLYVDPETGKPFYGLDAERYELNQSDQDDTFTFENNADELGAQSDWVDEYTGPMSDVFKKGKLLGQLGHALAQPGAIQRIGNDKLMNTQIQDAKKRQDELNLYKSDQAQKINELRAQGKHDEAAAIEREAREKIAGMSEMPGTSKGTQAMLATMQENPGAQWRRESEDEWRKWAGDNWAGMAETVVAAGAGGAANSGAGQIAGTVNINTTDLSGAFREMDRRTKRAARSNSRVVRR